jgi:thiamine phosphate synthase YjbQ (UPF0047 family)
VRTIRVSTVRREQLLDVTAHVQDVVRQTGVRDGICLVASPHTTCGELCVTVTGP